MEPQLKEIAEKTLKFLCVGSQVEGIKFYGTQLLFSETDSNKDRIDGQIYLNIESRFVLSKSEKFEFPIREEEVPDLDWIEGYKLLCELRLKKVSNVTLGEDIPHLFISFESGEILSVYGHHDKYEPWQLGVWGNSNIDEHWEVIVVPGDEIAIFAPNI
ncbi:hypothetical protein [Paenibacillus vini]|uniref:Uncharacterized protein n=1 Tax=Paenibacillus vini TaxID=1476024 RepID=A0ABQ4MB96_9BACL|nr:hypothetical protein [Paenibacillus vini]GIP53250.1 hypothetical protein J42TS3_22850 [Paenibacillus vini]